MTPEQVQEAYKEAYAAANGVTGMPLWQYYNGWYSIGYGKYRKREVLEMIENLKARTSSA